MAEAGVHPGPVGPAMDDATFLARLGIAAARLPAGHGLGVPHVHRRALGRARPLVGRPARPAPGRPADRPPRHPVTGLRDARGRAPRRCLARRGRRLGAHRARRPGRPADADAARAACGGRRPTRRASSASSSGPRWCPEDAAILVRSRRASPLSSSRRRARSSPRATRTATRCRSRPSTTRRARAPDPPGGAVGPGRSASPTRRPTGPSCSSPTAGWTGRSAPGAFDAALADLWSDVRGRRPAD